ncbi:MAG: carbohydrate binding domain-containing protein [Chloroflexi bacterium]|nr:carbohydrate binding domain-containing protein [Chloroflexota bacterium]
MRRITGPGRPSANTSGGRSTPARPGWLAGLIVLAAILVAPTLADALAPRQGQPLTLDYPRLGMWWPDPWTQSLDDIARYDWVILGDWAAEFIAPLRARNPDVLLLNSTNACELSFNPDPDAEPWENEAVLQIPPQWFLTQVGSTLVEGVDAATTTFHVTAITATDGSTVNPLFVVSDTVLVEGESALVEAVDEANRLLTVRRGYVRPAAAHAAGARLAPHITFWPQSWLLNVSTLCPTAVVSPALGAETWADYNARVAIDLVHAADWDGILLDRSDPDESWLIGNSTARTIDPDQSNTLLTDYTAFDQAWNAGLRRYESALRDAIGPGQVVFVNWGMANYDLLNGNNLEGFPMDDGTAYGRPWAATVLGPAQNGSYFEWLEQAQHPNLTMIETYEDDGGPDPSGSGEYDNPCDDPGFVPNYRKMRLGLTTALLHDGFFSYEINTNGHGSLCLLWFDEYDNAGAGRGYLGQPLGPAVRALPVLTTPNLVGNGVFEGSLAGWDLWTDDGYAATVALDSSTAAQGTTSARLDVTLSQGTDWQVSFSFAPVSVVSGTEYTISFWAKADAGRDIAVWVQQEEAPWHSYIWHEAIPLTTTWQPVELTGVADGSNTAAGFYVGLGATIGAVWLDDVQLQVGSRQVWRRDYMGGLALVNATASPQTVPLPDTFRQIAGNQAPAVNAGHLVTAVTLPPRDGLIVLRVLGHDLYLPLVLKRNTEKVTTIQRWGIIGQLR